MRIIAETQVGGHSWAAIGIIASVAMLVPTVLLGWLHFRLNNLMNFMRLEVKRLDERISKKDDEADDKFMRKETLDAKLDLLLGSIKSLGRSVADFKDLYIRTETKVEQQGKDIAVLQSQNRD